MEVGYEILLVFGKRVRERIGWNDAIVLKRGYGVCLSLINGDYTRSKMKPSFQIALVTY